MIAIKYAVAFHCMWAFRGGLVSQIIPGSGTSSYEYRLCMAEQMYAQVWGW